MEKGAGEEGGGGGQRKHQQQPLWKQFLIAAGRNYIEMPNISLALEELMLFELTNTSTFGGGRAACVVHTRRQIPAAGNKAEQLARKCVKTKRAWLCS